jgi:hypothetical protein
MWLLILVAGLLRSEGATHIMMVGATLVAPVVMAIGLAGMVGVRRRRLGRGVVGLVDLFVSGVMLLVFFACSCPASALVGGLVEAITSQGPGGPIPAGLTPP